MIEEKYLLDNIKVEKNKIFNYEIIKCNIPKYFYNSKLLKKSVDDTFNSKLILKKGYLSIEQTGKAYSTVGLGNALVTNLNNIDILINCISYLILKNFYSDFISDKKIFFDRIWMNKMYKNCSGKCHSHNFLHTDGTAVFYYEVPKNGSQLIILEKKINGDVNESHSEISHYIPVKTGDLIIHHKSVFHAVSKHMSDTPRICFVFDFKLKKNINFNYD